MYNFSLLIYFISLGILWSQPLCKGATHWIVTEDGRIQQQDDSIFNLKRPYDLVTFIQQQTASDRLKILREEYLEEKRKVIEAREKEREEVQKSFYKVDPDCVDAGRHISEFELHLDMTLPFSKKGVNIPDHLNLCESLPSNIDPPICRADLPTVIFSYDHLEGINHRHQLNATAETTLLTALSYFKTVEELGGQVSLALQKNSSSWVLLNLAAYYWRIKGNALQAVECLRQALYFSPREHKDRALMSLAAVLHHANYTLDSIVLLHTAIDTCEEYSVYHFLLGNLYASLKMYEMAELCYRFTMVVSPDTELLCERMKAVRCELKLKQLLQERQLVFDERLDSLTTPELDEAKELSSEAAEKKPPLPLETFRRQLNQLYLLTDELPKNQDVCKSRSIPVNQEAHIPPETKQQPNQSKKPEAGRPTHTQQDSSDGKEIVSSDIQVKLLGKAKLPSEAIEESDSDMKNSGTRDEEKTGEKLEATNSQSDSYNVSAEEKNMHDLEVARLALNRLKDVIKTVTRVNSASQTVDIAEDKGKQSEEEKQTVSDKPSLNEGPLKAHQKKNVITNAELRKVNAGRRGESGSKVLKRDSSVDTRNKEDTARSIIVEDAKLAKQKGESILMSKNGPGSKFASKNTREMPSEELLFEHEQAKANLPIGPKHTPPLKEKDSFVQVKKCENIGRKKRKGEAFNVDCVTQDMSEQVESSSKQSDEATEQSLTSGKFSEAAKEEPLATKSDIQPLDSDSETATMKQTSSNEISATTSSDSTASERTSEANALEESQNTTNSAEDLGKGETSVKKSVDKLSPKNNKNSETKAAEDLSAKSKASDGKQNEQAATSDNENPETNVLGNGERSIAEENAAKSKVSDKKDDNAVDQGGAATVITETPENSSDGRGSVVSTSSTLNQELPAVDHKARQALDAKIASQNINEQVKNAEFLHSVGAGSSVFETSFMNVHTDGSLQDLSDEECKHIEGVDALIVRNKQFSAWLSLDTKNIDVRAHIDFLSDVDESPRKPRCTAKIKNNLHTFSSLQGVVNAAYLDQVAEAGLTQTLLTMGRTIQDSVDEMGTRIYNALKKNSSSWVLLNVASLYWRVQGDTVEAIKCLRQALYLSPWNARDVAHVGLASILLRESQLDDTAVVIKKALEISPSLALGHFILGNVFGAQNNIPEAIQHYLLALQLEPGFTPAVERLKIIQCVLWKQQKALEKEAADLKKLLTPN